MHHLFGQLTQRLPSRTPTWPPSVPPPASPTGSTVDDEVLHTLKAESDRIAEKIHTPVHTRESVIALVSTVAGGVLALRGTSVRFGGIVALPYLMVAIMAYEWTASTR